MDAHRRLLVAALITVGLAVPGSAIASGGSYDIQGGTPVEQAQISEALNASSFDWSVVPARIHFHVGRGSDSYATPGQIWIDANLLDAGRFSWGVIAHEYAHQVDFFCLTEADRSELLGRLGGQAWWQAPGLAIAHSRLGSERFASTLAWSYWPSPDNVMRPSGPGDESAAMPPSAFRALIDAMLGQPTSPSVPPDVTQHAPPTVRRRTRSAVVARFAARGEHGT